MIYIVSIVTTMPGQRGAVLDEFEKFAYDVRRSPGCIEYKPTIDATSSTDMAVQIGADAFTVLERWESAEEADAHAASAPLAAYAQRVKALVVSRTAYTLRDVAPARTSVGGSGCGPGLAKHIQDLRRNNH